MPRTGLERELAELGDARVVAVGPDTASAEAFGADVLAPTAGGPSFAAGRTQAAGLVERIAAIW